MTEARKSKRSRRVVLTAMTAAGGLALQGCGDEAPAAEGQLFTSVAECAAAGTFTEAQCREAQAQAAADDDNSAPRFDSQQLCEEEFGNNSCQQRFAGGGGGGGFWTPLLAGFIIGQVIDEAGDAARRRRYAPVYRSRRDNQYYTGGAGYAPISRSGNGYRFSSRALERSTAAPRVHSRSSIASRGGFGGRSTGGWGG